MLAGRSWPASRPLGVLRKAAALSHQRICPEILSERHRSREREEGAAAYQQREKKALPGLNWPRGGRVPGLQRSDREYHLDRFIDEGCVLDFDKK